MKTEDQPDFVKSIVCLMDVNLTLHHINKSFEAKCDLSVVQWSLLKTLLNMPAVAPLVLAKALGITPGTLSQTLVRLEKKKYLFMCDDPNDARKKMISITRQGKETLEKVDKEFERVFAGINGVGIDIERVDSYLKNQVKDRLTGKNNQDLTFAMQDKTL